MHILLRGVVDLSKEITRLQKDIAGVTARLDKLKKKMGAADYATKCPAITQVTPSPQPPPPPLPC